MEKIILPIFVFFISIYSVWGTATQYSVFFGQPLTADDVSKYTANKTLANCTISVETCDPNEPRRIDGTCNNLKHPSYGGARTPFRRLLPAEFYSPSKSEFNPRRSKSGEELTAPRSVRTGIWSEGRVEDDVLTSIINHLAVYFVTDITNTQDTTNYVSWRPYCCKPEGAKDYACAPNKVEPTDFVHRFSGITCLNMTRPLTYQTSGCLPNTTTPLRMVTATPALDGSTIYGNTVDLKRRTKSGGKLVTVTVNNRKFPDTSSLNLLLGINFVGIILFWNNHNFIAEQLAAVNPCWDDEKLFTTAREINIAYGAQMFYYELMPTLMGSVNLKVDGVISEDLGFRDMYDENQLLQTSLEYTVAMRWLHSLQDGELRMYNTDGSYKSTFSIVNLTSNTDFLKVNDTIVYVTQGFFRQPTAKSCDQIADPDIVQIGLGSLQRANDIMTNDLAKNRYFGFPGYIKYIKLCFDDEITSFDDLSSYISAERIDKLKELYKNVEDIDLLAGIWVENIMDNAFVPPTFYCIVSEQLNRTMVADRHWYENSDRPNAFTDYQLEQIRKATVARLLCDVGEGVTEIQPKAFNLPSEDNEITSCSKIDALDFNAWKDEC